MSDVGAVSQGIPSPPPLQYRPTSPWTDERVELLKKLAAEHHPCSAIAAALGRDVSRNAVIGKLARLGISTGNTKGDNRSRQRAGKRSPVTARAHRIKSSLDAIFAGTEATELPPEQSDCAITFLQARDGDGLCRYPLGDPLDFEMFRFCGAKQGPECGKYCARHFRFTHRREPRITEDERQRRSLQGKRKAGVP